MDPSSDKLTAVPKKCAWEMHLLSINTVVDTLTDVASAEHRVGDLKQLGARQVDAFSAHLHEAGGRNGRHLSKASVHAYTRGVRGFLNWCEAEGEAVKAKPPLPRLPRRALDVLDRHEIAQLEEAASSDRDRLIIRILGDCGLRAAELCGLTVNDIVRHDRQSFLRVHGKGDRDRLVPLPPTLSAKVRKLKYCVVQAKRTV